MVRQRKAAQRVGEHGGVRGRGAAALDPFEGPGQGQVVGFGCGLHHSVDLGGGGKDRSIAANATDAVSSPANT